MGRRNILELNSDGASGPMAARPGGTVPGWNEVASRLAGAGQATRALALLHICMYNAWAAYDDNARQTVLGVAVRLPRAERDAVSKAAAMSHAAWHVLAALFPDRRPDVDAHMAGLGLDPAAPAGQFSPAGIGRTQAAAVLDAWHRGAVGDDEDGGRRQAQPFAPLPGITYHAGAAGAGQPAGHWCRLARRLSLRDGDDDRDVLLFFVLANALADAALAATDDAVIPAACAAAAAEALRRFTGGDLPDADGVAAMQAARQMENGAEDGVVAGRELGRRVGARVFDKARRYWQGKL